MSNSAAASDFIIQKKLAIADIKLRQHQLRQTYPEQCHSMVEQRHADFAERFVDPELRFQLNMAALANYLPQIYQFFANYQPRRFEPTFDGSTFNILDVHEDRLIYPDDGVYFALHQFEVFQRLPEVTRYEWLAKYGDGPANNYIHVKHMTELTRRLWQRVEYHQQLNPGHLSEVVHTGIAVGVGLGVQIEEWVTQCTIKNLYVIEPEPDFFYASLFVCDWSTILQRLDSDGGCLHISLELNDSDAFDDLILGMMANSFYGISFAHLLVHYQSPIIDAFLEQLALKAHTLISGFGFYDDSRLALAHAYANLGAGRALVTGGHRQLLAGQPLMLCANGPSLADLYAELPALAERMLIVSCGTTLSALHRAGIRPHLHVEAERPYQTAVVLEQINDPDYLRGITLIAPDVIHPAVVEKFGDAILLPKALEVPSQLLAECGISAPRMTFSSPTVTNFALAALTVLGADEIYLAGTDFGFPNREHHAPGSVYYGQQGEDKGVFDLAWHARHLRPGNRGDQVETSSIFDTARLGVELHLRSYPHIRCANLSRGVLVAGAEPMTLAQLKGALTSANVLAWPELKQALCASSQPVAPAVLNHWHAAVASGALEQVIDQLLAELDQPVADRSAALDQLQRLYAQVVEVRGPHAGFVKAMLRGTALYLSSFTIKYCLWPQDPAEGLDNYRECMSVYRRYLQEIKESFAASWQRLDDEDTRYLWQKTP